MPCRQASTYNGVSGSGQSGGGGYATEADCLNACKEGACCDGTTCSVKPQCQCQGTGKTFKGVGTTCAPNPCDCTGACCGPAPNAFYPSRYECVVLTQQQCIAKGGDWRGCNTGCPSSDEINIPSSNLGCASFNPLP